jgi:hypothetical protein
MHLGVVHESGKGARLLCMQCLSVSVVCSASCTLSNAFDMADVAGRVEREGPHEFLHPSSCSVSACNHRQQVPRLDVHALSSQQEVHAYGRPYMLWPIMSEIMLHFQPGELSGPSNRLMPLMLLVPKCCRCCCAARYSSIDRPVTLSIALACMTHTAHSRCRQGETLGMPTWDTVLDAGRSMAADQSHTLCGSGDF